MAHSHSKPQSLRETSPSAQSPAPTPSSSTPSACPQSRAHHRSHARPRHTAASPSLATVTAAVAVPAAAAASALLLLLLMAHHGAATAHATETGVGRAPRSFGNDLVQDSWCVSDGSCAKMGDESVRLSIYEGRGGSLTSSKKYLYGVFSVKLAMPRHSSSGVVPAFYLIDDKTSHNSDWDHAEIDFEFLGAHRSSKMIMHTNMFAGGMQNLWQYTFPFDPSTAYHTYTIVWGPTSIKWLVDGRPIRVTYRDARYRWPEQPMHVKVTFWEAGAWAGGLPRYNRGAKYMMVREPTFVGCEVRSLAEALHECAMSQSPKFPWNRPLNRVRKWQLQQYQLHHLENAWGWGRA